MWNAGLDEAQAGIKIVGGNINNLRYADDTTLMAESEEELNSFLMKMKEESKKFGLKLNIQKTKIMASGPITSWQIDGETMETETLFWGAPKSLQMVTAAMKLKDACSLGEKLWSTSVQFSSVAQSWPSLCDPMNHGTPGLPVHHQLPESTQTHLHCVGDAIQPSHPPSSPSPPALHHSQHQGLFKWVSSPHQVAKVLEFQLQHQSFQRTSRTHLL